MEQAKTYDPRRVQISLDGRDVTAGFWGIDWGRSGHDRTVCVTVIKGRIHTEDIPGPLAGTGDRWRPLRIPATQPTGWRARLVGARLVGALVSALLLGGR